MNVRRVKVIGRPSPLHGNGGYSLEYIPRGTLFVDAPKNKRAPPDYIDSFGERGMYIGFGGFNYSSSPNAVITGIRKDGEHTIIAIRDIRPNEEITLPYYDSGMAKSNFRRTLDIAGFAQIPIPEFEF